MTALSKQLFDLGEPYAGGFFEFPDRDRFYRYAHAQKRYWEEAQMPAYSGGRLYPSGWKMPQSMAMFPGFSYTMDFNSALMREKCPEAAEKIEEEIQLVGWLPAAHTVGGNGYVHSIPRYERVLRDGLDSYQARIEALDPGDFRDGLLEIIAGIRTYHARSLQLLHEAGAPEELLRALERVPFAPARSLYEALVCWNFIYYIDFCDNPGRLDADLIDYYRGEDITELLREFFRNVDQNDGWSSALGPDYNPLTLQCLNAIRGMRRPSLELRVTKAMPQEIWDAAAAALETGCGQPAFYCEERYQAALAARFPSIPAEDRLRFNGGGCTETMLAGISNVGSLDAGFNLPLIFEAYMKEALEKAEGFSAFYEGLLSRIRREILPILDEISLYQQRRAKYRPHPVRTLLIDDCIDNGKDFNAGGARYYWSVVNFSGLVNVIDSLLAIRHLVFETAAYSPAAFLQALDAQDPLFLAQARQAPCYGVDNPAADALAADFTKRVFDCLDERRPWLGGQFLPSSIQFATYADAGTGVGATPDGRAAGSPLADSIGAVHGKDIAGPTAMLTSAAKLPLQQAAGTPVLNIRLQKRMLKEHLRPLVTAFFEKGGMQLQVSCLSREDILAAMEHPEEHQNLIVRIGGYSEYFCRLSPALQQTVLERTEFGE